MIPQVVQRDAAGASVLQQGLNAKQVAKHNAKSRLGVSVTDN